MNKKDIFFENYKITGTGTKELMENLENFYGASEQLYIEPNRLCLCSVYQSTRDEIRIVKTDLQMATFSNLFSQIMTGNKSDQAAYDFFRISKEEMYERGLTPEELDDVIRMGMYFEYEDKIIILSERFLPYMTRMLNLSMFERGMNPIRELFLANQLFAREPFYMTVRSKQDVSKVFYASTTPNCSAEFIDICSKVIEHMTIRGAEIIRWEITQEKTEINFCYPEFSADGFRFGVVFRISDTGEYATTLGNEVIAESSIFHVKDAVLSKKNYGRFDVDEFLEEFEEKTKGSLSAYQEAVRSLPEADSVTLWNMYREVNVMKACGKNTSMQLETLFSEALLEKEQKDKGYASILKLPVFAESLGVKEYVLSALTKSVGSQVESLIRR